MTAPHNRLLAASPLLFAVAMAVNAPLTGLAQDNIPQAHLQKSGPDHPNHVVDVRDVENPARKPIQFRLANINANDPTIFDVPLGTRLVIEFVSATGTTNEFCVPVALWVTTTADGVSLGHSFAPTRTVAGIGRTNFVVSQQTRLYGDPGTTVTVAEVAATVLIGGNCVMTESVTFSGYLVTLP